MNTTAAIKTLEVLKRIALPEFAADPGMHTASGVSGSYGEVYRRWCPCSRRRVYQGFAALFQPIWK